MARSSTGSYDRGGKTWSEPKILSDDDSKPTTAASSSRTQRRPQRPGRRRVVGHP